MKTTNSELRTVNQLFPPCQANCPVNTDVRGYVAAIGRGDHKQAYRLITERNYFPSVCGLICPHPCEDDCRRGSVDEEISIARCKRFVADYVNKRSLFPGDPVQKTGGKKVAVIGSGPAGLTVAADLVREGHEVIVFEKDDKPGGMLYGAIPRFRLDKKTLNEDIVRILNLGIKLNLNIEVGKDIKFDKLIDDFNAVVISTGLPVSKSIPLEGVNSKGIIKAIDFLKGVNKLEYSKVGKRVVVIGGGNVAIDAAKTAIRLGAEKVFLVYRRSAEEMPAYHWEVEEAVEEGIAIYTLYWPKAFRIGKGKVKAVDFVGVRSILDKEGRFNPQYNEKDIKSIQADTVILATGQTANLTFLKGGNVELNERGQLMVDQMTFQTTNPKVFGCGEVAKGPGAAIDAIAHAHKVAQSASRFLKGDEAGFEETSFEKLGELPDNVAQIVPKAERQKTTLRDAQERVYDFDLFEEGLSEIQALNEAHRCLGCTAGAEVDGDKCATCITCVRVCPYEVPAFKDNVAYVDPALCQACGFCAADCPAQAIAMKNPSYNELNQKIEKSLKEGELLVVTCEYAYMGQQIKLPPKAVNIIVPCAGRLDVVNLMKAFESGAKKVIVNCENKDCRHIKGLEYIKRRAAYVNEKLKELGFEGEGVVVENKADDSSIKAKNRDKMLKRSKDD